MLITKITLAASALFYMTSSMTLAAESPIRDTAVAKPPACHAQLGTIRTAFPKTLQARGEHGDVTVNVTIDKDGRATNTQVAQSSGYPSLDKAAAQSVSQHWRFDVSRCASTDLPTDAVVIVQFQRAARYTVSGTVNRRRAQAENLQSPTLCDVVRDNTGDAIVTCAADKPLVGGDKTQSLANRTDISSAK